MPNKECKTCGDEFSVKKSREDSAKFCSRGCYHKGQKLGKTSHSERRVDYIEVTCTGCGKTLEKTPSRAKRSERQFCSQDCYLKWNKSHQEKQVGRRQRMREKEEKRCDVCGWDRFLEMAHIVPSRDGGTYHKNNILFLCPNHHRLLDHGGLSSNEFLEIENALRKAICEDFGWKDPEETDTFFESDE